MLCQVYVRSQGHLGDDDVWTMLGKEKVVFPRSKAGVVTQVLDRFSQQAIAARSQVCLPKEPYTRALLPTERDLLTCTYLRARR